MYVGRDTRMEKLGNFGYESFVHYIQTITLS